MRQFEDFSAYAEEFVRLQSRLPEMFERVFPDRLHPRTVLVIPSLTLDSDVLAKISGVHHYDEHLLCLLRRLCMPQTRIIYVTSGLIDECIVDYSPATVCRTSMRASG